MDVIGYDPRPDFPHEAARRVDSLAGALWRNPTSSACTFRTTPQRGI